ncbi:GFA family protein [Novosphingobium sp. KCTC 2891]|uniref:GFA family protein n=1 Tax=Novosphingobium sp. KCTC 2891 TaxID=2989730 RepID=UPI0022239A80|nr:GFA family protein [Novosphingobium sp. KCTC 2891]MCW1381485.1 GFA family protein [Novosphingobium sp. KCTC 2891]
MLKLACLCGQVHYEVRQRPDFINECNCTLCRKSGARWAYFHPDDVTVQGASAGYSREDKPEPGANLRFCPACGSTTHFTLTESAAAKFGNTMMGVNMRLAPESDLAGIELRYPDGAAWAGEGDFTYVREARIL